MESRKLGAALAIVAVVVAAILFVVLRDDEDEPVTETAAPATETVAEPQAEPEEVTEEDEVERARERAEPAIPTIVVRNGEPVDGVAELTFRRGDRVQFAVRSDAEDEVHVHGYDIYEDVEAGRSARVAFEAEFDGIYEVELHGSHVEIARLTIRP